MAYKPIVLDFDRRQFLRLLGISGVGLASVGLLSGCDIKDRDKTILALMNVIIPDEGPKSPGAVEAGAFEALELESVLTSAQYSWDVTLPADVLQTATVTPLQEIVKTKVANDLNQTVSNSPKHAGKMFTELSFNDQIKIVEDRFENSLLAPLYEFIHQVCLLTYFGAVVNDRGFVGLGLPEYKDFKNRIHNTGYTATEYSYNAVPTWNGVAVTEETIDGNIP